jgi:F-type H+-transporting ATPase subunit b
MYMSLPTMIAEILSFVIFVLLLQRLAFPPIANILEQRRRAVGQALADAQREREEAERLRQTLEEELAKARQEAKRILDQAMKQAGAETEEILARAKAEAEALVRSARDEVEAEKVEALRAMRDQVAELSVAIAEKILRREVDEREHHELIDRFLAEVGGVS